MNSYLMKLGYVAIFAAIFNLGLLGSARAGDDDNEIRQAVFFGDSLSDSGNVFALLGRVSTPPWSPVPSLPYGFGGGFQFSNDIPWPRHFAERLDFPQSGKAFLFNPGINGNYAFGGARVGTGTVDPTSAASQVALYLAGNDGKADDETVFVFQFGGNDIREALFDPPNALDIVMQAVQRELALIRKLHDKGARHFLVIDVPDLGQVPVIRFFDIIIDPETSTQATGLSVLFNSLLESGLRSLEDSEDELDDVSIRRYSFFAVLNAIIADPAKFGIDNALAPCLETIPFPGVGICPDPDAFLFWDGLHPTGRIHEIVGHQVAEIYPDGDDDDDDDDDDEDDDEDDDDVDDKDDDDDDD